jgi:mRNA interferase MazF
LAWYDKPSYQWVKISQVRTLSTERLGTRVTRLQDPDLARIVEGLVQLVG